jgi:hypothetical protein
MSMTVQGVAVIRNAMGSWLRLRAKGAGRAFVAIRPGND